MNIVDDLRREQEVLAKDVFVALRSLVAVSLAGAVNHYFFIGSHGTILLRILIVHHLAVKTRDTWKALPVFHVSRLTHHALRLAFLKDDLLLGGLEIVVI